jgi:hypothetical protein
MNGSLDFLISSGVPRETIIYILMLPIIATIVALVRQVIGFKTFGIYIPSILTIIFLSTGIVPGLIVFVVVLISGFLVKWLFSRFRLLYLPRMALMLTLVSLIIFGIIALSGYLGITSLSQLSIFAVLIMIILVERFLAVQIERGTQESLVLSVETLLISIAGYFILVWQTLQNFIFNYPWVILFIILINIFLGRWTGLRLTEYFRFKELFKDGKK